ncbi:mavicyanin-like [Ipomoea triloba]|uniref:mavicyanin-like n=1 Tax=Ipomoea triloba TaxID=35885 RepID=UPI00125DA0E4|nr:mavicyanin-like [Ipomoea triloba]
MASTIFFIFLTVAILAVYATATDYIVGDEYGWTTNVDYQAWAKGKQFVVGDKLIFKYPAGTNSVYKVGGNGFKQCIPPAQSTPLTTGNDVIELGTPGRKWYISGSGQYCKLGQKLVITVSPKPQAPSPATWPRKLLFPAPISWPPIPAQVPAWPIHVLPPSPFWPSPIVIPPSPLQLPIPHFPFPPFGGVPVPAPDQGGY